MRTGALLKEYQDVLLWDKRCHHLKQEVTNFGTRCVTNKTIDIALKFQTKTKNEGNYNEKGQNNNRSFTSNKKNK